MSTGVILEIEKIVHERAKTTNSLDTWVMDYILVVNE